VRARSTFLRLLTAVIAWGAAGCLAQTPAGKLDAAALAEATLGTLQGTVAVGILRGDKVELVIRRRDHLGTPLAVIDPQRVPEPVFEIGSVSKVFTGLLAAQNVEAGTLHLDDTLGELLRDRVQFQWEQAPRLTVKQLLTHTSCLPRWPTSRPFEEQARYERAQVWALLGNHLHGRTPPCETKYSNFGYTVLGELLAETSGPSWESQVLTRIARPAGMSSTAVTLPRALEARLAPAYAGAVRKERLDMKALAAAGGLRSTATDLLAFSRALLAGRRGPFGAAAERLVAPLATFQDQGWKIGYGVLLPAAPPEAWVHNGETIGYLAEWIVWPGSGEAVVILVSNHAAPANRIMRSLVAQTWTGSAQEVVYTRGELRSALERDSAGHSYVRIKVVPRAKLPFSTLTFRVLDPALLAGLQPGALVEFRAERKDGENTLTAIRPASPCAPGAECW
jgi:CubicO group peptidase (beta-lactamase class C family)